MTNYPILLNQVFEQSNLCPFFPSYYSGDHKSKFFQDFRFIHKVENQNQQVNWLLSEYQQYYWMKWSQNKGKIKQRHTIQTEQASENSSLHNSNYFSAPSTNKKLAFPQFNDVPNSQSKLIKPLNDTEDKQFSPFSLFAPLSDLIPKLESSSDVSQITSPKAIEDSKKMNESQKWKEMVHQKSAYQLAPSSLKPPNLNKSQTEPCLLDTNHYEGFQIKTNLVNDTSDFKRDKVGKEPQSNPNKTMAFLQINPPTRQTSKALAASRIINDTRISLKDYLYMAKVSSRKAAQEKRHQLKISKKTIKTQQSEISQNVSSVSIKSRYQKEKYHINNDEMADVLKSEIADEMNLLRKKMDSIKIWMDNHKDASADELLLLYDMRRDVKQYNTKFEESIEKLYSGDNRDFIKAIRDVSMKNISCFANSDVNPNQQSQIMELQQL